MSRMAPSEQLFDELAAFNRRLRMLFDARARASGLTLSRARALFALARRGALNQTDLAQELEIETPTLVRLLDGMENKGLIERRVEDGDRRVKQIHMTATGQAVGADMNALANGLRDTLLAEIPKADLEAALRVMQQLNRCIQTLGSQEQL